MVNLALGTIIEINSKENTLRSFEKKNLRTLNLIEKKL